MLTAEVRGIKVLEAYRLPPKYTTIALTSPYAKSLWEPRRPPEYRARHGIYLWALPTVLLDAWEYMRPVDRYYVVALVRAVPRRQRQLELEPVRWISSPNRVDFCGADVLWHRNYVGIARAVRIERLIVHRYAPRAIVALCSQYGVPVHVSQCDAITVADWTVRVCSEMRRVALHTAHATVSLPGRTVSGTPEDESLIALVRETIEQAVAEIRGRIEELLRTQGVCDADG
ncbi:MAG: hypothetical protein KatS3mg038_3132 [Candidatus Kapaibacterium sp.]|nr:MAG: hypothetical protein KatS3mg038_3131 [Candidatus Kapabacteria bacterium]GIV52611.1 MAG: hypothetical protein KatS3mg038_3132 [Candidatus Kapabacteria bacterium]